MIKYFNSEKFRIVISVGKDLIAIDSGETFESKALIPELVKYLVEDIKKQDIPQSEDPRAKTPGRIPGIRKVKGKTDGSKT
jgi:hypothetical protein